MGSAFLIRIFYLVWMDMGGVIFIILSYKIGAGPFFFWFPRLCSSLEWSSCYILMLFQKFLPLLLISLFVNLLIWIIVIVRLLVGVIGSFNQVDLKQLIAYSSVHHLGWIIIIIVKDNLRWIVYLIMYGLLLIRVVLLLYKSDIINVRILVNNKRKIIFIIRMLSIGGIPPMLGFFLKWMALINVVNISLIFLIILVLVSVIILYVYIRIVYDVFMGGGVEGCNNCIINYYTDIREVISIVGIFIGIVVGCYVII